MQTQAHAQRINALCTHVNVTHISWRLCVYVFVYLRVCVFIGESVSHIFIGVTTRNPSTRCMLGAAIHSVYMPPFHTYHRPTFCIHTSSVMLVYV